MQLSQHLFGAQLAVYRATYSMTLLPGDRSVFTPPTLPPNIPGELTEVVGAPSDEEIKSAQGVVRTLDNLSNSPHLFDPDLSMKLSQHMFNLQFARYMHDSSEGNFVSETEPTGPGHAEPQQTQGNLSASNDVFDSQGDEKDDNLVPAAEQPPQVPPEMAQLGETMKEIREATNESKEVLKGIHRVLTLIQSGQCSVAGMDKIYHMYKNPVNRCGVPASEYGLPHLRYGYYQNDRKYAIYFNNDLMARYLKFFGVGADLIQGDENPKLRDGKYGEAEKLILKEIGIGPY